MRKIWVAIGVAIFAAGVASADPLRLVALGDSLTQGYGLPQEDGFVPQLQRWLTEKGADVVITNAGVSGDTTAGGLSRVNWTLSGGADAMIVALGGNDMLRGIDPAVSRANLDGILRAATEKNVPVLLVGMSAPGNYGPDYKAAFEGMYPDLADRHQALLYPDFLQALLDQGNLAETRQTYIQADGIHPNAAGVRLIVAAMGPSVLELLERAR